MLPVTDAWMHIAQCQGERGGHRQPLAFTNSALLGLRGTKIRQPEDLQLAVAACVRHTKEVHTGWHVTWGVQCVLVRRKAYAIGADLLHTVWAAATCCRRSCRAHR